MLKKLVDAIQGKIPFDLVIRNVRIVNVYQDTVLPGSIGVVDGRIAFTGRMEFPYMAKEEYDGHGQYALPGFVDSHMHLESSMLTPAYFSEIAVSCGTTTVAADPHEIGNVLGLEGVRALVALTRDLPLRVLMMAPSTIPSAPGFEGSGCEVGPEEAAALLDLPGMSGLGEVMDFNGVANGDARILSVIETAAGRGCILDGHASVLTGRKLQAFRATGIDSDHTTGSAEKLLEELSLGFTVQIQESMLSEELVSAMNTVAIQNRICLVTDDVPLPRLMREGHLNHVVEKAISLGLDSLRAIRYASINPADRLRLYRVGAIAPGMTADIQLVDDLLHPHPSTVICGGIFAFENGKFLLSSSRPQIPDTLYRTVRCAAVKPEDFTPTLHVPPSFEGGTALVNVIHQDGVSMRTKRIQRLLPVLMKSGRPILDTSSLFEMAVFNRYGKKQHGIAFIDGMEHVHGAVALTYGHDSHNLAVFGNGAADMAVAANAVIKMQGGICAACGEKVTTLIPLPLAGLLSEESPDILLRGLDAFLADCERMGFHHANLMSFFTIMPLAVSPEIKCTDMGLVDVVNKQFLPLIERIEEGCK
ncbi:adenine deaminase C-terminal domain-containing protein [Oscillibacter sp.]|uniref:adenine deaminase C-terminal domain-containing protein n=1 Tax=Oscillibacter sp. TaxID=1945593 RepID=UPI00289814E1|nr:adenine deaminase C-terminal domain-containing protein [Oscillibacter sp.]